MSVTSDPRPSVVRAWTLLGMLSLLLFMISASTFSSLGVVLPKMIPALGWSYSNAFLGFTLLGAFCGASSWLPARMIRRVGVRGTIIAGSVLMVAGLGCFAVARGLVVYYIGASICGVAYQMMALIPATHILGILFKKRALPFGVYFTVGSLGGVAGPWMVLAVLAATRGDWRAYWWVQAVAAAALGVACAWMAGDRRWLEAASKLTDAAVAEDVRREGLAARVHRTADDWTVGQALRTPQFWILMAAYFSHLLGGVTVASLSVSHLTEIGVAAGVAAAVLSLESLMQTLARLGGGLVADRIDPRWLLAGSQLVLAIGLVALSVAKTPALMGLYAVGTGVGFGMSALAVTILLLNYFGRKSNLELFSLVCLAGAPAALGPFVGGIMRDHLGGFAPTFDLYAALVAVVFVAVVLMRPPKRAAAAVDPRLAATEAAAAAVVPPGAHPPILQDA